jgi:acyl-CoA synthetase (AMP-forming)/AMP-acid ligase II
VYRTGGVLSRSCNWLQCANDCGRYQAIAIYHKTANNTILRRSYLEFADRARGLAYYLLKHNYKRVGILCTNTPAFLEALFGIAAAGAVSVGVNYRLKTDDISYIFQHSEVDLIIADYEFVGLLEKFKAEKPDVKVIVDTDTDATEGQLSGPFDDAVLEGLTHDRTSGNHGWAALHSQAADEESIIALAYTSGTTARPKGVEYTHRGCYLAALGNIIESGLNYHTGRAKYLWTLPMFHATGWTFPWVHQVHVLHASETYTDSIIGCYGSARHSLLFKENRLS